MIDESRVAHREEAGHMSTNLTIDEKLFAEAQ